MLSIAATSIPGLRREKRYSWVIVCHKEGNMRIQPMPLARMAAALRSGELDLIAYLEQVLKRLDEIDSQVQAFLPEPDRRTRVLREVEA